MSALDIIKCIGATLVLSIFASMGWVLFYLSRKYHDETRMILKSALKQWEKTIEEFRPFK